jgi:hypothetical protein
MNERISEIWDQAAKANALLRSGENSWETQKAFIEKFAELIVRECMEMCYRTDTEYEGKKVKPTVIASKVATHFGVEE